MYVGMGFVNALLCLNVFQNMALWVFPGSHSEESDPLRSIWILILY